MIKKILKTAFLLTSCLTLSLTTTPAHATLSNTTLDFMGQNGIYYYNPEGSTSANCLSGSNATYSGAQILNAATTSAIQANQAFYKNSADQYGFDWRIIATIHIMENSAKRSNQPTGKERINYIATQTAVKIPMPFFPLDKFPTKNSSAKPILWPILLPTNTALA